MKTSPDGLRLIQSFEGYHKALPGGGCEAYLCPAGVWTIGYGCTEGVRPGMRWTRAEADAAFAEEIEQFERAVTRLVTREVTQHQFDALVSLAYNIGAEGLRGSTVLRKFNAGDIEGAAKAFHLWNKATVKGKLTVLPGLTSRRAREASHFQKPDAKPAEPYMPQAVSESPEKASRSIVGTVGAAAGTAAGGGVAISVPQIASPPDISQWTAWQSFGETMAALGSLIAANPLKASAVGGAILIVTFWPWICERVGNFYSWGRIKLGLAA